VVDAGGPVANVVDAGLVERDARKIDGIATAAAGVGIAGLGNIFFIDSHGGRVDRGLDPGIADGPDVQQVHSRRGAAGGCVREQALFGAGGHDGALGWRGAGLAIRFIREKEKGLIFSVIDLWDNPWAPERDANAILELKGRLDIGGVIEPGIGIQKAGALEPIRRAVQVVGAALGHHGHLRRSEPGVRTHAAYRHIDLFDGIHHRRADGEERAVFHGIVLHVDTVLRQVGGVAPQAVDKRVAAGDARGVRSHHARERLHQVEGIASRQRHILELGIRHRVLHLHGFGLDLSLLRLDHYFSSRLRNLQLYVDFGSLRDEHRHGLDHGLRESGVLHGDLIVAVVEVRDREIALCVRGFLVFNTGPEIRHGNVGAWNGGVAGVRYGARQSAGQNLGIGDAQREGEHQEKSESETAECRTGEMHNPFRLKQD
jgi:hypothetical protein